MLIRRAVQLALVAAALLWESRSGAAPAAAVKFCGRQLGDIMSRVCHAYNSPSWDVPTVVVEQTGSLVRRRRHLGIADECCTMGCTWEQLSKYCSVSAYSESPLDDIEAHMIADRSAEQTAGPASPAVLSNSVPTTGPHSGGARREVGRARSRGYGRARARGRRCWCRRKRRSGRRRSALMGNMGLIENAARAAPVVGTVSPLLTWGRTLNTDLPIADENKYAYVAIYT